eukprot:TRINITY_DN14143_c0_g1_i1.p1 TRINITY_DN14143_c0_g1~~TRINITY_DN14143_c0_g1_i1.p1  ORF type:complete len:281 (+),score=36.68 TRINITY_DN14143_c0_g1_i1:70-912(+)
MCRASTLSLWYIYFFFFLMIRRPPRSTQGVSSAASDVYKRQILYKENTIYQKQLYQNLTGGQMQESTSQSTNIINPELKKIYEKETVLELSNRSKGTTAAYIIDYILLVLLSPIYSKAPNATIAIGILFFVMIAIKIYSAKKTPLKYDENPGFWYGLFLFQIYLGAVSISVFILLSLIVFGLNEYSLLFLLLAGGMSAGATSSMAPRFSVALGFKTIVMVPVVAWGVVQGQQVTYSLSALFLLFFVILLSVTKKKYKLVLAWNSAAGSIQTAGQKTQCNI